PEHACTVPASATHAERQRSRCHAQPPRHTTIPFLVRRLMSTRCLPADELAAKAFRARREASRVTETDRCQERRRKYHVDAASKARAAFCREAVRSRRHFALPLDRRFPTIRRCAHSAATFSQIRIQAGGRPRFAP